MIAITCTNCQAGLMIDDAFAGGVCRCQHCGTIQTVPAKSKASASKTTTPKPVAANAQKALFQNQSRVRQAAASAPGTGLDDIASAVASSGLSDSGLTNSRAGASTADAKGRATKRKSPMALILIASGVVIGLLVIVLIVVLIAGRGSNKGVGGSDGSVDSGGSDASKFCGIPLHMGSVIFVLDRGNSLSNDFDTLKAVTFNALDQLGPTRKFQVILWDNDSGSAEFPPGQMKDATNGATTEARRYFQDTIATGRSHLSGALKEAVGRAPQEIVIATGKGAFELDDEDIAVLRSTIGRNIRIDAVQIQSSPSPIPELQEVSRATGGQFKVVSPSELRSLAH